MKWISVLSFILLISCTESGNNSTPAIDHDSLRSLTGVATHPLAVDDSILHRDDTLRRSLSLEKKNVRVETGFEIPGGDSLFVELISDDPKANIRITQIQMPDSTFDGPFGKALRYKLKQHGHYTLIFGPNMMAEGPWAGNFDVKAWVK